MYGNSIVLPIKVYFYFILSTVSKIYFMYLSEKIFKFTVMIFILLYITVPTLYLVEQFSPK